MPAHIVSCILDIHGKDIVALDTNLNTRSFATLFKRGWLREDTTVVLETVHINDNFNTAVKECVVAPDGKTNHSSFFKDTRNNNPYYAVLSGYFRDLVVFDDNGDRSYIMFLREIAARSAESPEKKLFLEFLKKEFDAIVYAEGLATIEEESSECRRPSNSRG